MANSFMIQQCQNMITCITVFESACKLAAKSDDGIISKSEEKTLKKIKTAGERYKKELATLSGK